jgi:serine/threonine protein kinase
MLDLIGKRLGQYQILEEIGRGGMAVVYKAYQPSLNRYVAIKVLLPDLSQDREFVQRFRREALAAAKLEHSNIIRIHDVGQEGDLHYLVMSYVAGPSLAGKLAQEGALDPRTALSILRDVGAALDLAHSQGVIHRDVKPSNILLTPTGQAILTDFGIARALSDSRLTQTGTHMGTPAYMSPEQAEGETVDARTDLYSLGIVLYEMLTGRVPFQADTPAAVLYKQVHATPPPPSSSNPALSKAVEAVVLRALDKDKTKRYQHGSEMADALARATTTQVVHKTPVPPIPPVWYNKALLPVGLLALVALIWLAIGHRQAPVVVPTATPPAVATVTTAPPTSTPVPTATRPPPTKAPSSTATAIPTSTSIPTATPAVAPSRTRTTRPTAAASSTPTRRPTAKPSPTPMLIKGPGLPVYLFQGGVLHWVPNSQTFDALGYQWDQVVTVAEDTLLAYSFGDPLDIVAWQLRDGELVTGTDKKIYLIDGGRKRWITEWAVFELHGFKYEDVAHVTDNWLEKIEDGPVLSN